MKVKYRYVSTELHWDRAGSIKDEFQSWRPTFEVVCRIIVILLVLSFR